jgi:hypothetical protein
LLPVLSLVLVADHITAPLRLQAPFLHLFHRLIVRVGAPTIFSGRLHQRQRLRLIAGTGGSIDRVSGSD